MKRLHAVLFLTPVFVWGACGAESESEVPDDVLGMSDEFGSLAWTQIAGTGQPVIQGSTAGAANEYAPPSSCSDGVGPDLSYRWTAPSAGAFTFDTVGSPLDTVLHIYDFSSTTLLGCNDDIASNTYASRVTLNVTASQELRIVVDSHAANGGSFGLNIAPACTTPPSQCLAQQGTWNGSACTYPAKPNGSACDDGNACTQTDTCQSGTCTGGNPRVCTAQSQCHNAGTCNPSTGTCSNPT
ncbi:hypothetical protein QHF85_49300, partial [Polyangium sp. 6x1]|nr:hypothetical protein [Polyangium sp. 6x1]